MKCEIMIAKFEIVFRGHENIVAKHKSTLEITKEDYLTKKGDCIIGICSSHSCFDLPENIKKGLKKNKKIKIIIQTPVGSEEIIAFGNENLILTNKTSIVIRKSDFIDDRTLCINANKSAKDIDRKIIDYLKNGGKGKMIILIEEQENKHRD